jgi:hypothetical protein
MQPLQVTYNFQSLESMFRETVRYREQFLNNNLQVEITMYIGINTFQAIFVVE